MKYLSKILFSIVITCVFSACSDDTKNGEPINVQLTRSEADAVNAVNDFTFDLLKATEKNFGTEKPNYIMSPQSLAWCIAMVANGAEPNSETLKEMIDILHLGEDATLQDVNDYSSKLIDAITSKNGSADIRVANALHYKNQIGINPNFVNTLKTFYKAGEFKDPTNKDVDNWISDRTGGMIKDFAANNKVEELGFGVLNTLYFDGVWEKRFDPANTKEKVFHNADGTTSMPLMMNENMDCQVTGNQICHLLKLFFKNKSFAISFVIPTEGNKLSDVLENLDGKNWREFMINEREEYYFVRMPKLDMKSDFDFIETAKDMGLQRIFTQLSQLNQIASSPIMIQQLAQSSIIKLDENGVKAATVSHKGGGVMSFIPGSFILDEPFYYFITEESTGAILFAGKVSQL